jgi:hypothetical protein
MTLGDAVETKFIKNKVEFSEISTELGLRLSSDRLSAGKHWDGFSLTIHLHDGVGVCGFLLGKRHDLLKHLVTTINNGRIKDFVNESCELAEKKSLEEKEKKEKNPTSDKKPTNAEWAWYELMSGRSIRGNSNGIMGREYYTFDWEQSRIIGRLAHNEEFSSTWNIHTFKRGMDSVHWRVYIPKKATEA